ncbi:MAG: ATP-binding protein [Pyrodictiaceae archaeon]
MPIDPTSIGVEIGVVLSRSSSSLAPILLRRDVEVNVREEDLAIIVDETLKGYYMFGVIRWITRHEPFLRQGAHNIYVEYPEALTRDLVMPFSNAYIEIYGAFCDERELCGGQGFTANTYAPHPSSRVYKVRDAEVFTKYLAVKTPIHVGNHKYTGWRLPLDPYWLPYHVGVFGATGTGKSRLVAGLVTTAAKRGYSFIIFDHTGVDYAPAASRENIPVVPASRIKIPVIVLGQLLSELMGVSGNLRDYVEAAVICHDMLVSGKASTVEDCLRSLITPVEKEARTAKGKPKSLVGYVEKEQHKNRPTWSKRDFIETLINVTSRLGGRDTTIIKLKFLAENYIPDYVLTRMENRTISPTEIIELAKREGIVVVDLSSEQEIEVKRSIVSIIAREGWKRIFEADGQYAGLQLGIVVDEAQNYACEYCGMAGKELETIAREGRKWGYFLVVASQRIARDIRPGIRSNLGTVFFSRLQATGDLQELSGYLDLGRLSESSLAMLASREFFIAGLMNPLRRPILLRIDEIKGLKRP